MNRWSVILLSATAALWLPTAAPADALPITAGLVLQLDASDVDGDGLTDTPTALTALATWADKSPGGNDVANGSAAAQPNQVPGVLNGLPVVRFTGSE